MSYDAIYLNIATGHVIGVGLENNGENNTGAFTVDLYSNAITFVWGDPTNEGHVWGDDLEKEVSQWGVPFLKNIRGTWENLNGYEIDLLCTAANSALEARKLVTDPLCKGIYNSITKGF